MTGSFLGVDSRIAFTILVGLISLQRLWEMRLSDRNRRELLERGAHEVGSGHYPIMVVLHGTFLVACVAEVWVFRRPWIPVVAVGALAVLTAALALRWWTLTTLGERSTTRVLVVPGEELVSSGPYRWLRHPNYLVVVMEIAAIPMVHCAWMTAAVFTIANLVLLRERIRVEEGALSRLAAGGAG